MRGDGVTRVLSQRMQPAGAGHTAITGGTVNSAGGTAGAVK